MPLTDVLRLMKKFGYEATLFVFRKNSKLSLVIGEFSETQLLDFGRKLAELQAEFGDSFEIELKPRPNDPSREHIILTYHSTWTVQYSVQNFLKRLRFLQEAIFLWKMKTLYDINSSELSKQ